MARNRRPEQRQSPPGRSDVMRPRPADEMTDYVGRGLLAGKVALVTGGDSGIGRAVCIAFAKEGADVALAYLCEHTDAEHTAALVRAQGRRCLTIPGDLAGYQHCADVVARTMEEFRGLDVLVNNVATQQPVDGLEELDDQQWLHTFDVNIHSYFRGTRARRPYLGPGSAIINTGSVNGLRGNRSTIDYSTTKGAVHAWTFALAQSLLDRKIRVNCVAPGPVWTPLIPSTMPPAKVASFGQQAPMGRAADPDEIAPSYVFFAASQFSSYYTGQVLTPTGGEIHPS